MFNNSIRAIKQKPKGKGEIEIKLIERENVLEIQFRDNGVGIPEININEIFDLLFTTKVDGTGFGLPICKRIVNEHNGGNISAKSVHGDYTNIIILLNLEIRE